MSLRGCPDVANIVRTGTAFEDAKTGGSTSMSWLQGATWRMYVGFVSQAGEGPSECGGVAEHGTWESLLRKDCSRGIRFPWKDVNWDRQVVQVGREVSEWDAVSGEKDALSFPCRRYGRYGSGKSKALKQRDAPVSYPPFSFSSSTAPPAGPSRARELPRITRRLICEAEEWLSTSPHAPVR